MDRAWDKLVNLNKQSLLQPKFMFVGAREPPQKGFTRIRHIPAGTYKDPDARVDAAVIALKTEQVQFNIPLFPRADW